MTKRARKTSTPTDQVEVQFGPLTLVRCVIGSTAWIEVRSITDRPFDQHHIEQCAQHLFPDCLLCADGRGTLVKLEMLAPILYAAGFDAWAAHLPHVADLAQSIPARPQPNLPVDPVAPAVPTAFQIREMHALLGAGHSLEDVAHAVSLDIRGARRIASRGFSLKRLSIEAQVAYRETFLGSPAGVTGPLKSWLASQPSATQAMLLNTSSHSRARVGKRSPHGRGKVEQRKPADSCTADLDFGG